MLATSRVLVNGARQQSAHRAVAGLHHLIAVGKASVFQITLHIFHKLLPDILGFMAVASGSADLVHVGGLIAAPPHSRHIIRSKRAFDPEKRIGWHIFRKAMDLGLVLRPIGDVIYFNPPLTIDEQTIDEAVRRCRDAVHAVLGDV